jgi:hypothetical protein
LRIAPKVAPEEVASVGATMSDPGKIDVSPFSEFMRISGA